MHENILESSVAELPDGPIFSLALFCASRCAGGTVSIVALDLIWNRKMNVCWSLRWVVRLCVHSVQCGRAPKEHFKNTPNKLSILGNEEGEVSRVNSRGTAE